MEVSDSHKNDFEYFAELYGAMENKEVLAAMLHDLLQVETSLEMVRKIPETEDLAHQKIRSMNGFEEWYLNILTLGKVLEFDSGWKESVSADEIYSAYSEEMAAKRQRAMSRISFGKKMRRYAKRSRIGSGNREYHYWFGSLDSARDKFCTENRLSKDIWDADDEEI